MKTFCSSFYKQSSFLKRTPCDDVCENWTLVSLFTLLFAHAPAIDSNSYRNKLSELVLSVQRGPYSQNLLSKFVMSQISFLEPFYKKSAHFLHWNGTSVPAIQLKQYFGTYNTNKYKPYYFRSAKKFINKFSENNPWTPRWNKKQLFLKSTTDQLLSKLT